MSGGVFLVGILYLGLEKCDYSVMLQHINISGNEISGGGLILIVPHIRCSHNHLIGREKFQRE